MVTSVSKELETTRGTRPYVSTTNACKLCTPLGAALAYQGIEGAIPFLHGSQGCATYMRRYLISHFREPVDIASSSLGEKHAVYGGGANLKQGIRNVVKKYHPQVIGIATTCLTETIGDDVPGIIREFAREIAAEPETLPLLIAASTPSYSGTHTDGFHAAVRATVDALARTAAATDAVNLLPGPLSPADYRYLREIVDDFSLTGILLPDLAERLDGPALDRYEKIPSGGTPLAAIRVMGGSCASLEFGRSLVEAEAADGNGSSPGTAASLLAQRFAVPHYPLGTPIGLRETDAFFQVLEDLSGRKTPAKHDLERGRLVDAYVDGHKYLFGKRAVVYGEEDLVIGLTAFLVEVGITPVLCASGGQSGRFAAGIEAVTSEFLAEPPLVRGGVDFYEIAEEARRLSVDLMIGNSKGYRIARELNVPLIRVGFPIHDRFGGQRLLHVGYRGTQSLLDRIINAILDKNQNESPVGYGYL